ncbi:hypothetical protein ABIB94_007057 [Bradyrhizobium sp. JR7.2]|uniref:recombination protein NinB n=1 Tax=Bradyrhizobium sp. JR7.2 TaxID=3156375 RepID=UPI00339995ED
MSRAMLTLRSTAEREQAIQWVRKAPTGSRVEFKGPSRSVDQNSRFWAMLTDVAVQGRINDRRFNTEQWKTMFMAAYAEERGLEIKHLPALNRAGMIPCGRSSSDLSVSEMSELMEWIAAWGAENGIKFHDQEELEDA